MTKFVDFIPEDSLNLVKYSGNELINRLGENIISNVVLSILCGDNIRNLTESLTQRRILLMNASLLVTYLKALGSRDDLASSLTSVISREIGMKGLSNHQKTYLYWFMGLTGKKHTKRGQAKRILREVFH